MRKVGYDSNPLEDGSLEAHGVDLTGMTMEALSGFGLTRRLAVGYP